MPNNLTEKILGWVLLVLWLWAIIDGLVTGNIEHRCRYDERSDDFVCMDWR